MDIYYTQILSLFDHGLVSRRQLIARDSVVHPALVQQRLHPRVGVVPAPLNKYQDHVSGNFRIVW